MASVSVLGMVCSRQFWQILRTSRWASTASSVAVSRNGGTPMSRSRVIVLGASLVCSVLNTMCPVERGLHGDLGRLQVADLAHQDLVRVLPQDRAQALGEGVADVRIDGDLHDAVDLVLHRVLGGDELVRRSRSTRSGRRRAWSSCRSRSGPVTSTMPLGLRMISRKAARMAGVHAHGVQVEHDHGAVQDPHDHALAEHGGQHADAEVDRVAAHGQADAAVLRQPPLGDVEVRP